MRLLIGSVKRSKLITSSTISFASSVVSGSKLDMNVFGEAISDSAFLSNPRWMASSGRWKNLYSQFWRILTLLFSTIGLRFSRIVTGTTVETVISSSI